MPRPPAPTPPLITRTVFEVIVHALLGSQAIQNILYYRCLLSTGDPAGKASDLAGNWFPSTKTDWLAPLSIDYTLQFVSVRPYSNPTVPAFNVNAGAPIVGTKNIPSCPPTDAVILTKTTSFRSRRAIGRNYFAGVPETDQLVGTLKVAAIPLWDALAATLSGGIVGGLDSYVPIVLSRASSNPLTGEAHGVDIFNMGTEAIMATQRRRRVGRGI